MEATHIPTRTRQIQPQPKQNGETQTPNTTTTPQNQTTPQQPQDSKKSKRKRLTLEEQIALHEERLAKKESEKEEIAKRVRSLKASKMNKERNLARKDRSRRLILLGLTLQGMVIRDDNADEIIGGIKSQIEMIEKKLKTPILEEAPEEITKTENKKEEEKNEEISEETTETEEEKEKPLSKKDRKWYEKMKNDLLMTIETLELIKNGTKF